MTLRSPGTLKIAWPGATGRALFGSEFAEQRPLNFVARPVAQGQPQSQAALGAESRQSRTYDHTRLLTLFDR